MEDRRYWSDEDWARLEEQREGNSGTKTKNGIWALVFIFVAVGLYWALSPHPIIFPLHRHQ